MTVHTTTGRLAGRMRRPAGPGVVKRGIGRLLASIHDLWDGSSFEQGRHSLTRVQDPGERQAPR